MNPKDLEKKLTDLKAKHLALVNEYQDIYINGTTSQEQFLVDEMSKIETTFQQFGLDVNRYNSY